MQISVQFSWGGVLSPLIQVRVSTTIKRWSTCTLTCQVMETGSQCAAKGTGEIQQVVTLRLVN